MRTLDKIDEFRTEAENALFTKQQALSITLKLLELELESPKNDEEDKRILEAAIKRVNIRYLDATNTDTDNLLDAYNVARLTAEDILEAINVIIFEAK